LGDEADTAISPDVRSSVRRRVDSLGVVSEGNSELCFPPRRSSEERASVAALFGEALDALRAAVSIS